MIPDIRFKSDQSKWTENTLGKFITVHSERNSIRNVNVLSVSNTKGFIHQSEQFDNHIVASNDTSNYKIVKSDWFAYNPARINVGSIAKNNLNETGIVSPMYEVFECNTDVLDSNYLNNLYKDNRFNHWVVQQIQGTVRQCLKIENMKAMPVSLPDIEVQKKISALLSNIDLKIKNQQKKVDKIKEFKQAMLIKMFPQEGRKVPEIRFEGFTDDWEQRKLGDIAEFNPKAEIPDVFEYVDLESVIGTEMVSHRQELKLTAPSRAQRLAKTGDLFYQMVRPYQKNNYLYEKSDKHYVFSTGYAQMRPHQDGYFLLCLVQNNNFVQIVLDNCTGTSYPAINANDLANIEVKYPFKSEEQVKIGMVFRSLDNLITLHQCKFDKLIQIKKALLYKLMPVRS